MNGEQTGQVIQVGDTQTFGSGFSKRELVIEYAAGKSGEYTNMLAVQMHKDNCAKLDGVNVGDVVTVKCRVKSREYQGRYYTDVVCWHVTVDDMAGSSSIDNSSEIPYDDQQEDDAVLSPF